MKKCLITISIFLSVSFSVKSQYLVSSSLMESKTIPQIQFLYSLIGQSSGIINSVDTYSLLYRTVNAANVTTTASGIVMIPTGIWCSSFPLLSFDHGTVLHKDEVPSKNYNLNIENYYFSSKGYVVTAPDYIGLGSNPGFHPYCHSITEAKSTIDLIRAAREFIATTTNTLDGKVFITGYSQGGHAAMATLKHIQENNLTSEFNVVAGAPMSGPYSLSKEQPRMIGSPYNYNAFIPYITNSYQNVYGNLYANINAYYDSPYDVNIPPMLNGATTFTTLNAMLPVNSYSFMQDTMINNFIPDTFTFSHPLRKALKLNDTYSWAPVMPMRLLYCTADDIVRASNTKMAYDTMLAHGALNVTKIDVSPTSNHVDCELPALANARAWFNTFRTDCAIPTGINETETEKINIKYPNPATGEISIGIDRIIQTFEIVDLMGKIVFKDSNTEKVNLKTSNIQNGLYFIRINNQNISNKIIIMN